MLMTHLLSAVFKGVVMLSQGSIHFRRELINIISYAKKGGYRAMSECSKYQLLLPTDYVRRREKYDYLYIYSHNTILNCPVVDRNSTDFLSFDYDCTW